MNLSKIVASKKASKPFKDDSDEDFNIDLTGAGPSKEVLEEQARAKYAKKLLVAKLVLEKGQMRPFVFLERESIVKDDPVKTLALLKQQNISALAI